MYAFATGKLLAGAGSWQRLPVTTGPSGSCEWRIGADENGLGPRLGPMVVTAILARVVGDGARTMARRPRGKLAERLGDSKALVSHGDVALAEAWTRALVRRSCGRDPAASAEGSVDTLVHAVLADDRSTLRAPCPSSDVAAQCWSVEAEELCADEALVSTIERDLERLADKGVEVTAVRAVVVCTRKLNDAAARGMSRFVVDLHAMERLVLELGARAGAPVDAVCGKVGGFDRYGEAFGPLSGRLHVPLVEGRAKSQYHFPGVGRIAFVRDGDASDMLVSMASLVGKYLREALMARIVRHYRALDAELPTASGYHDPVTARFVDATQLVRARRNIPDDCFERRAAAPAGPESARGRAAAAARLEP